MNEFPQYLKNSTIVLFVIGIAVNFYGLLSSVSLSHFYVSFLAVWTSALGLRFELSSSQGMFKWYYFSRYPVGLGLFQLFVSSLMIAAGQHLTLQLIFGIMLMMVGLVRALGHWIYFGNDPSDKPALSLPTSFPVREDISSGSEEI